MAERGVDRVLAPYTSWLSTYVLRTAGFDEDPTFPFRWDPPHVGRLLREAGYHEEHPVWTYRISLGESGWREAAQAALAAPRCVVRPVDKRPWRAELELITDLYNDTFTEEWEFHPLEVDEVRELYDPFKPLVDPATLLFAEVDGTPVGMCLTAPDFAPALRRARGRLGPIATLRFLRDARHARRASAFTVGVRLSHRGRGIGRALLATALSHYAERGFTDVDYHLVNDANRASRALAETFGGRGRVLHHGFERLLD